MSRASACTTGKAKSAASAASAPTASATRPLLEVMISGNSALAMSAAASSIAARAGSGASAPSGRTVSRRVSIEGAVSTSRGKVR